MTPPGDGDEPWKPVRLDPERRAGVLTRAGFLAAHTPAEGFSPVRLGAFVRTRLLCQPLPPPPNDVPPLPVPSAGTSARERFGAHTSSASCSPCHALMGPIGFGFERYDGVGRYREVESGTAALSGEGVLTGTDVDGPFGGPGALGSRLAGSAQVTACFAAQLLSFGLGRDVTAPQNRLPLDEASLRAAVASFEASGGDLRSLVVSIATSDAFRLREIRGAR